MKESKYNFFIEYDLTKVLAYNARTNALAIAEKDEIERLSTAIETVDKEILEKLKYGGFLLEDEIDEKKIIKLEQQKRRFNTSRLGITIAPTLGCNFNCVYCYENTQDNFHIMTDMVQDKLIEYVENKMKTIKTLDITWYGGEPLLAMNAIERLSKRLIKICEGEGVSYGAYIVTNGYLISEEICEKLVECKITGMQITLDGGEDTHNKKRPLKNGKETFDVIVRNLEIAIKYNMSVSVRINTDKMNMNDNKELVNILCKNDIIQNVYPYVARITPTEEKYGKDNCLSVNEFAKVKEEYTEHLIRKNDNYVVDYPHKKTNYCGIDQINSYVVDPEGNFYKCWDHIGNSKRIVGSLVDNKVNNLIEDYEFLLFDPTNHEKCAECKILPLCMGGCPNQRKNNNEPICNEYILNLEKDLIRFANKRI